MPDTPWSSAPTAQLPTSPLLGERAELVYHCLSQVLHLPGDVAECGAYEAETAAGMGLLIKLQGFGKTVHAFDTFSGFPDVITSEEQAASTWPELRPGQYAAHPARLARNLAAVANIEVHMGLFPETFPGFSTALCFIHSDSDLYASTLETIALAERLLVPGGAILIDDYGNPRMPGVQMAVDRCLAQERFDGHRIPGTIQYLARRR